MKIAETTQPRQRTFSVEMTETELRAIGKAFSNVPLDVLGQAGIENSTSLALYDTIRDYIKSL
jgi:hypothetical protein